MVLDLPNVISLILASFAVTAVGAVLLDNMYLEYKLRKSGVPLEFIYVGVPFYLLSKYLSYKESSEIDLSSIPNDFIDKAKRNIRYAFIAIFINLLWFWLYLTLKVFFEV